MPIPWMVVLQSVPWTDVIRNAPKVADAARKLLNSTGGKKAPAPANATTELQAQVAELQSQMQASTELIKQLAEQNTLLVARIQAQRVWIAVLAVGVVAALAVALLR